MKVMIVEKFSDNVKIVKKILTILLIYVMSVEKFSGNVESVKKKLTILIIRDERRKISWQYGKRQKKTDSTYHS